MIRLANLRSLVALPLLISAAVVVMPGQAQAFTYAPGTPAVQLVTLEKAAIRIEFTKAIGQTATGIDYSLDGGATWTSSKSKVSPLVIPAPVSSTPYSVSLRATNAYGVSQPSAPTSTTKALFLGASITYGYGSGNGRSWSAQAAATMGWQYINGAIPGTGWHTPVKDGTDCVRTARNIFTQVGCNAGWKPDIVVLSGGFNDCAVAKSDPVKTQAHIVATINQVHTLMPQARIIVTPVITFSTDRCMASMNAWLAAAAASVGAQYVTGADRWLVGHREWNWDGVHPNLRGHTAVAGNFVQWYNAQTPASGPAPTPAPTPSVTPTPDPSATPDPAPTGVDGRTA